MEFNGTESEAREWCRSLLNEDEEQEQSRSESDSQDEHGTTSGWTPADNSTFVFVGNSDIRWPQTKPGARRAAKKEAE